MTEIYLAVRWLGPGTPDDVVAAFDNRADAERLVADKMADDVLPIVVHDAPLTVGTWYSLTGTADVDHHNRPPIHAKREIRTADSPDNACRYFSESRYKHGIRRQVACYGIGAWDRDEAIDLYHKAREAVLEKQKEYDEAWKREWRKPKSLRRPEPFVTFPVVTD
ncbi:hypothetical protein [Microbispora sp. NPDC049633]|uniref:hypothetical protein n=1 Tax=Microbispora sp. NPDC049633 TaxID=3154355 RepID=UPI00343B8B6E